MKWYVQECGMLLILEGDGVFASSFRIDSPRIVLEGNYGSLLALFKDLEDWVNYYCGHQDLWGIKSFST